MKKNLLKGLGIAFLLAVIFVATSGVAEASYTKSYGIVTTNDAFGRYLVFTHTFVARTDTVYMPFYVKERVHSDTVLCQVSITSIAATDSLNIKYQHQWSDDNSHWSVATVLVNDTTITGAATALVTNYKLGVKGYGGFHPYNRLVAIGLVTAGCKWNDLLNKFRITIVGD